MKFKITDSIDKNLSESKSGELNHIFVLEFFREKKIVF
jgi:hypothetical protein